VNKCKIKFIERARVSRLGVNKRNHDVSGALGDPQALMVVGQSSRVHKHPALSGVKYGTVISDEATTSTLKM
jgi:hypothetical protein